MFSVLVPTDFTPRSAQALQVAANLVKEKGGVVHLLHILENLSEAENEGMEKAREMLTGYARKHQEEFGVTFIPHVVNGNIFTSIGDTAFRLGASLIVMGVHGVHGIQFIIGSFAVRVILGSVVPVLLINSDDNNYRFKNVVMPFDSFMRMDYLLEKTIELARQHGSTVHVFSLLNKLSWIRKKLNNRKIRKAAKRIRKAGLNCQIITMDGDVESLADGVLQYAANIKAQLITLTMQSQNGSNEYLIGKTASQLVEKANVPLYIVNPLKR